MTLRTGPGLTSSLVVATRGGKSPQEILKTLLIRALIRAVKAYKVETALADDGLLASDHRPVFADISI